MEAAHYVVPDHGLGAIRTIAADVVAPAIVDKLLHSACAADLRLAVEIDPPAGGGDAEIYFQDLQIGTLRAEIVQEYAELTWIKAAGLTPQVSARVARTTCDADALQARQARTRRTTTRAARRGTRAGRGAAAHLTLELFLPEPGLLVPVNNPPTQQWVLLEPAHPHEHALYPQVDLYPEASQAVGHGLTQVLTTVGFDSAGEVVVCVDGTVVGQLDIDTGTKLAPTLRYLEHRGFTPVARGLQAARRGEPALTLTVGTLRAGDMHPVSPFPPIPPLPTNTLAELELIADAAEHDAATAQDTARPRRRLFRTLSISAALALAAGGSAALRDIAADGGSLVV